MASRGPFGCAGHHGIGRRAVLTVDSACQWGVVSLQGRRMAEGTAGGSATRDRRTDHGQRRTADPEYGGGLDGGTDYGGGGMPVPFYQTPSDADSGRVRGSRSNRISGLTIWH